MRFLPRRRTVKSRLRVKPRPRGKRGRGRPDGNFPPKSSFMTSLPDMRLQCDSDDTDDNDSPSPEGMDVGDGGASSSQCLEPNLGPAPELVHPVHSEHPFEAAPSVLDPLFNAAGKAPHPDAVIVKQGAGWFQLHEEKRHRKAGEKLAL
jgi:hypothetical protein